MEEAIRRPLTTDEKLDNVMSLQKSAAKHLVDLKSAIERIEKKVDDILTILKNGSN